MYHLYGDPEKQIHRDVSAAVRDVREITTTGKSLPLGDLKHPSHLTVPTENWATMADGENTNSVSAVVFLVISILFLFMVHVNGLVFQVSTFANFAPNLRSVH